MENAFHFGDFPQLSMITFDRVGGVDQAADLGRISKEGNQIFPVVFPRTDRHGIFVTPFLASWCKLAFGAFARDGLIGLLQIDQKDLAIVPGDIF
jgi:hypothetical protein